MAGLYGLFDLGSSAMIAHNAGVATAGRNIANVNTEGYMRQSVDLASEQLNPGGVRARGLLRSQDNILARREREASRTHGEAEDLSLLLSDLEGRLAGSGEGMITSLADFFGSLGALQARPMDETLRASVLDKARGLGLSFAQASESIASAQADADRRISGYTQTANNLAQKIADLNRALNANQDPALLDARDLAAQQLTQLVGGQARVDPDGKMRFVLDGGAVLVDGERAASLRAVADAAYGNHVRVDVVDGVHVKDVTGDIASGKLAAQITFRDNTAATAASDLDQLAFDLATQVNAVHRGQAALDGTTGRDLFVEPAVALGAAAAFAVDATIAADPRLLAVGAVGAGPGDATGIDLLLSLRDDSTAAGGGSRSFLEEAIRTIGNIGVAAQRATSNLDVATAQVDTLQSIRDSVSGVSMEEEFAKLSQFQHASEATYRLIQVVDSLLGDLIQIV